MTVVTSFILFFFSPILPKPLLRRSKANFLLGGWWLYIYVAPIDSIS